MISVVQFVEYAIAFLSLYLTIFFLLLFLKHWKEIKNTPQIPKNFKSDAPFISVVIPAYNEEDYIESCVNSVLKADYPKEKVEIIIIDDGSVDATPERARSIAKKNANVKVFRKENKGKAAALNYGIAKARGDFIATLDADSYIEKNVIWKMLSLFEDDEVAAATAAIKIIHKPEKNTIIREIQKVEYIFTLFSRKILTFVEAVPVTPGPFSVFRAWVFKKLGGFDESNILEDQEMALRIQRANYKIRSSLDAEVFTEVPENFSDLLKQRIRWHRGGLRNSIKYLDMISPNYGDFGLVIMPLSIIAVLALFGVFIVSVFYHLSFSLYYPQVLGFESLWLGIKPIHIIGGFILVLNIVWIVGGIMHFKKEKISAPLILIYLIAYSYLLTIYWTAAIIKEMTFEKLTW